MDADRRPHRSRSWRNAKSEHADPATFAAHVETRCTAYAYAPLLEALGCHVVSTDEMTGIPALARAAPTKPLRPGCPERREHEYIRHGCAGSKSIRIAPSPVVHDADRPSCG